MIPTVPGHRIIGVDWIGTAAFTVAAIGATLWLDELGPVSIVVSVALFAVGIVLFLAAFAKAVSRSRFDEISVAGVYLLMGGCAPRPVQVRLFGALAVQTVVAITTASIRPFTDLAYGILVPMFGLACCGLWGAYHGTFPARTDPRASLPADD